MDCKEKKWYTSFAKENNFIKRLNDKTIRKLNLFGYLIWVFIS